VRKMKKPNSLSIRFSIMFIIIIIGLFTVRGYAEDGYKDINRETLKGIPGLFVLVEHLSPEAEQEGLQVYQIQTDVELEMRKAGIRVLTKEEHTMIPSHPTLYIYPKIMKMPENQPCKGYFFDVQIRLLQIVRLTTATKMEILTPTWEAISMMGSSGGGSEFALYLRNCVKETLNQFINAYLAVNPKK
jgi:hypothetical protein